MFQHSINEDKVCAHPWDEGELLGHDSTDNDNEILYSLSHILLPPTPTPAYPNETTTHTPPKQDQRL